MIHRLRGLGIVFGLLWSVASTADPIIPDRFLSTGKYDFTLHHHNNELGMIFPDKFQDWLWIMNRTGNFSKVWKACEAFQGPKNEDYRLPTRTWVRNATLGFLNEADFWISGCTTAGCTVAHVKMGKVTFTREDPVTKRFPILCSAGSNYLELSRRR